MKIIPDLVYDHLGHQLDLYLPEGPGRFPTLLYFHGGGLEAGSRKDARCITQTLVERGIAVASADYRLYPEASYPDFLTDCASAAAWVLENIGQYGGDGRVALSGSSAGGYITMMLCFDPKYLDAHGLTPMDFSAFIHDAGQPTKHFNVLREAGLDTRRVIVDETAALYHVGTQKTYPPMLFLVSDGDMTNRYEQTLLMCSTLKHFGHGEDQVQLKVMHGGHCAYLGKTDDEGRNVFGMVAYEFLAPRFFGE